MSPAPLRLTQVTCIVTVLLGLLPWVLLLGTLLVNAVESGIPLTMCVVAWMVLLVPLWVAWFAGAAWTKRDESAVPAVLMATPVAIVMALFLALRVNGVP